MSVNVDSENIFVHLQNFLDSIDESKEITLDDVNEKFLADREEEALRCGEAAKRSFDVLARYVNEGNVDVKRLRKRQKMSIVQLSEFEKARRIILSPYKPLEINGCDRFPNFHNQRERRSEVMDIWHRAFDQKDLNEEESSKLIDLMIQEAFINLKDNNGYTPLHLACLKGQIGIVNRLIKERADVNALNQMGHTPLLLAVEQRNKEVVDALIKNNANVNMGICWGWSLIQIAVENGDAEITDTLLKAGVVLDKKLYLKQVQIAAQSECIDVLMALSRVDQLLLGLPNTLGRTALHYFVRKNEINVVNTLLKAGFRVDTVDANGWAALHFAVNRGNKEMTLALIEAKANINLITDNGSTPLYLAAHKGYNEIVHHLLKASPSLYSDVLERWMVFFKVDEADQVLINIDDIVDYLIHKDYSRFSLCSGRGPAEYIDVLEENGEVKREDAETKWDADSFELTSILALFSEIDTHDAINEILLEDGDVPLLIDRLLQKVDSLSNDLKESLFLGEIKEPQDLKDQIVKLAGERTRNAIPLEPLMVNYLKKALSILDREDNHKIEELFTSIKDVTSPSCEDGVYNRMAAFLSPLLLQERSFFAAKLRELKRSACHTVLLNIISEEPCHYFFDKIAEYSDFQIDAHLIRENFAEQTVHFLPAVAYFIGNRLGFSRKEGEDDYHAAQIYWELFEHFEPEYLDLVIEKLNQPEIVTELLTAGKQSIENQLNSLESEMMLGTKTIDDFDRFKNQFTPVIKKYLGHVEFGDLLQEDEEGGAIVSSNLVLAMLMDYGLIKPKEK